MFARTRIITLSVALFMIGIVAVSLSIGVLAHADHRRGNPNRLLRGDYAATQLNTCVTTRTGHFPPTFDQDTLALVGPAEIVTFQTTGLSRFDGNGGWSGRGKATALFHSQVVPGDSPVGPPLEFTCTGRYSVARDRSFRIDGSCQSALFAVSPVRITGSISRGRRTLIFHDVEPTIENVTVEGNLVAERICVAIATDVKAVSRD